MSNQGVYTLPPDCMYFVGRTSSCFRLNVMQQESFKSHKEDSTVEMNVRGIYS